MEKKKLLKIKLKQKQNKINKQNKIIIKRNKKIDNLHNSINEIEIQKLNKHKIHLYKKTFRILLYIYKSILIIFLLISFVIISLYFEENDFYFAPNIAEGLIKVCL